MIKDVRNILFCKTTFYGKNDIPDFLKAKNLCAENLVTFGYYDSLNIYKLNFNSDEHILSQIEKENIDILKQITPNILIHPLCGIITDEMNITNKKIACFWDKKSVFLCCTSVYYADMNKENTVDLYKEFKKKLNGLDFIVYKSLGYSDCLIFWKTNDLKTTVKQIEQLSNIGVVEYYNTIVSVDASYSETINENLCVDYLSINLISNHYANSKQLIDAIDDIFISHSEKKAPCYLNCNFDLNLIYTDVNARQIVDYAEYLKNTFIGQNNNFLYINTHIGNEFDSSFVKEENLSEKPSSVKNAYERLKKEYECILVYTEKYSDSIRALGQLLNLLLNMSENRLYLSACRLLYKSIKYAIESFLVLHEKQYIDYNKVVSVQNRFVHRLLRGCWTFVDSILNQELSYVQELKYRPLVTNVNVNMIEYYNGLFYKITNLLSVVDKKYIDNCDSSNDVVSCLIVPKLCRRVKTYVHDIQCLSNLLFIDLPINMLSDCLVSVESIAHEISHKWGDYYRFREERQIYFLKSVAVAISYNLLYHNNVSQRLYEILRANVSKTSYFDKLQKETECAVMDSLSDDMFIVELVSIFLEDICLKSSESNVKHLCEKYAIDIANNRKMLLADKNKNVHIIINDLYDFFKECYADIFMINLLDVSIEEYLCMFNPEVGDKNKIDERYYMLIQRIVIVLLSLPKKYTENIDMISDQCVFYKEIYNAFCYFSKNNKNENIGIDSSRYYVYDIIACIIKYLEECWNRMENSYQYNEFCNLRKEIRTIFRQITSYETIYGECYFKTLNEFYSLLLED